MTLFEHIKKTFGIQKLDRTNTTLTLKEWSLVHTSCDRSREAILRSLVCFCSEYFAGVQLLRIIRGEFVSSKFESHSHSHSQYKSSLKVYQWPLCLHFFYCDLFLQLKTKYQGTEAPGASTAIDQLKIAFDLSEESYPGICDRLVQKVVTRVRE